MAALFSFLAAILLFALLLLLSKQKSGALLMAFAVSVSGFFAAGLYGIAYLRQYTPAMALCCDESAAVSGILEDCGTSSGGYSYVLRLETVNGAEADSKLLVRSSSDLYVQPGDRIAGTVSGIESLAEAPYGKMYLSDGIFLTSDAPEQLTVTAGAKDGLFLALARYRGELRNRICRSLWGDEGGLLAGIVLGDTGGLSYRAENSFRRSGISHIFCVSGFHVSAWSLLPYLLLSLFPAGNFSRAAVSSVFVLLVVGLTGFSPSALRAAVMLLVVYLSGCVRLEGDMLNSLGFALLILCFCNPFSGGSASLLLSACATAGIVLFREKVYPPVQKWIQGKISGSLRQRMVLTAVSSLLISFCVNAVMLPALCVMFGRVSLYTPLANLLLTPLAEIAMMAGGLSAMLNFRYGIKIAGVICRWMLAGGDWLAAHPSAGIQLSMLLVAAAYCGGAAVFCLVWLSRKKKHAALAFCLAVCALTGSLSFVQDAAERKTLKITAVGGERLCLLVEYDRHSLLLCTAGGSEALPVFARQGVYNLDVLLCGGKGNYASLTEVFHPDSVILPGSAYSGRIGEDLLVESYDNGGWRFVYWGTVFAVVPDNAARRKIPDADVLFLETEPADDVDLSGYEKVLLFTDGTNQDNKQYLAAEEAVCLRYKGG